MAKAKHITSNNASLNPDDLGPGGVWAKNSSFHNSQLFGEYLNRLVTGRDMHIVITAASETGVGKTTLAVTLAHMMDQHGWTADKAAIGSASEYSYLYDEVKPGSVLLLDEAEKAVDARRGMAKESVEVSQAFAAKRYQQVFGILTAPTKSWIDNRLGKDSADYWIQCEQTDMGRIKGQGTVYRLKSNEHYERDYTKRTETIAWPNLDWESEFQKLDKRKVERLESSGEKSFYHKDEVEDIKESIRSGTRRELEDEIMQRMDQNDEFVQKDIGNALGISQSRVSQRLNAE